MRDECAQEPGPGVLAYVDGVVAGWCSVAPRSSYRRLMNSRTIPFLDDRDAWSIVCFVVRAGFRRRGLMHELLAGAVAHARECGAEVVEGYPVVVPRGDRVDVISGYVGTTRLFAAGGFVQAVRDDRAQRRPRPRDHAPRAALTRGPERARGPVLREPEAMPVPSDPPDGGFRRVARVALGLGLLFAGISHLTFARQEFRAQVPSWVPVDTDVTVLASGAVEVGLGAGLVLSRRRVALGLRRRGVLRRDLPGQRRPVARAQGRLRARHRSPAARATVLPAGPRRVGAVVDRCARGAPEPACARRPTRASDEPLRAERITRPPGIEPAARALTRT